MKRWCLWSCVAVLVFGVGARAEPPGLEAVVDAAVAKAGVTPNTPGVAVCVIEKNEVVFRKGYGLANLAGKTPVRPETIFELASVTKQFTAVAVCILHERQKLSFDDPARKYIPELPVFDAKNPIRIRNLLQHTSGLPDYTAWPEPKGRDPKFVGNEDYAKLIKNNPKIVKPDFSPGQKYEYSNTNFLLLALIVERLAKKSYGTFLHEEVLKPLGMVHSWVYERPSEPPKHQKFGRVNSVGYTKDNRGVWKPSWGSPPFRSETLLTTGDGGLWTSIDDMARWDSGVREHKLIKAETWNMMLTPSKTRDGKTNNYGFGMVLELDGKGKITLLGHTGAWGGFSTAYYRRVPGDFAVVVLSNAFNVGKIHSSIFQFIEKGKSKGK